MKETMNSEREQARRKLLLMAPLAVVPSLVLIFFGFGGGKGTDGVAGVGMVKGINMSLPMAQVETKGKAPDKLAIYAAAARDSARLVEKLKQDPYAAGRMLADDSLRGLRGLSGTVTGTNGMAAGGLRAGVGIGLQTGIGAQQLGADAAADRVLSRVVELKKSLQPGAGAGFGWGRAAPGGLYGAAPYAGNPYGGNPAGPGAERLMGRLRENAEERRDPQLDKWDGMLDKVYRIQHPELVGRDTGSGREAAVVLLEASKQEEGLQGEEEEASGFIEIGYGDKVDSARPGRDQAIEAMINGDQILTAGSTVALRLTGETSIGGERLTAGQLVYGLASLSGERLMINIASLRVRESIVPVALQVYDLDGLAGIRVPGALSRDVSKESASEAMSGLGLASVDPSLGSQAASASLQFAKSLASRKVRLVRVSVPAGYRVLLKNTKSITH